MNSPILNPPTPPPLVLYPQFVTRNLEPVLGSQNVRKELLSLCQEFVEKTLSINFREDKTNSIFFSKAKSVKKIDLFFASQSVKKIDLFFASHCIKQLDTIECFGCQLAYKLSGKVMATKVLKKANARLKFLYRQT